jgi:hypothetical protein
VFSLSTLLDKDQDPALPINLANSTVFTNGFNRNFKSDSIIDELKFECTRSKIQSIIYAKAIEGIETQF